MGAQGYVAPLGAAAPPIRSQRNQSRFGFPLGARFLVGVKAVAAKVFANAAPTRSPGAKQLKDSEEVAPEAGNLLPGIVRSTWAELFARGGCVSTMPRQRGLAETGVAKGRRVQRGGLRRGPAQ